MNQREIAQLLGVSQTAVSMVLNDPLSRKVSLHKRDKILNYLKDSSYKHMSGNKISAIGYFLPDIMSAGDYRRFYDRFIMGIEEAAAQAHYNVVLERYRPDSSLMFSNKKFEGIILEKIVTPEKIKELAAMCPVVVLNSLMDDAVCDMVYPDNYGGLKLAVKYLIDNGHSRIAYFAPRVSADSTDSNFVGRLNGFYNACRDHDINIKDEFVQIQNLPEQTTKATEKMVVDALKYWFELPERPTAVICCNDSYALLMIRQANMLGIRLPKQLSIIGSDNLPAGVLAYPSLTSIDHNAEEMGRLSVELLLKRIHDPTRPTYKISCNAVLNIRESVAPIA